MEIESVEQPENKFVVLLGKRFPVILCNKNVSFENFTATNSNEIAINSVSHVGQAETSAQSSSSPDDQEHLSLIQELPAETNQGDAASGNECEIVSSESLELCPSVDVATEDPNVSVEDAVNIALGMDAPTTNTFEYKISPGNVADENVNTNKTETHSTSEEPQSSDAAIIASDDYCQTQPSSVDQAATNSDTNEQSLEPLLEQNTNEITAVPREDVVDPTDCPVSVSSKLNILDYAQSEWKGTTYTAKCLRNGYQMLTQNTGCRFLRQIRGDNYCALRASTFQILSQNIKILSHLSDWKQHILELPDRLLNNYRCTWLRKWTFANRLPCDDNNTVPLIKECLKFLCEQKEMSEAMAKDSDRQAHFSALFNSGSPAEIKLFEAMKLLMLDAAVDLYNLQSRDEEVPVFAWLLFARDTSENPEALMLNHLNPAGSTGGLEQVSI